MECVVFHTLNYPTDSGTKGTHGPSTTLVGVGQTPRSVPSIDRRGLTDYPLSQRNSLNNSSLCPGHRAGLLFHKNGCEKLNCFAQSFPGRHQAIFMFDAQNVIITNHPQIHHEFTPVLQAVSPTYRSKVPGSLHIIVRFWIQCPINR